MELFILGPYPKAFADDRVRSRESARRLCVSGVGHERDQIEWVDARLDDRGAGPLKARRPDAVRRPAERLGRGVLHRVRLERAMGELP